MNFRDSDSNLSETKIYCWIPGGIYGQTSDRFDLLKLSANPGLWHVWKFQAFGHFTHYMLAVLINSANISQYDLSHCAIWRRCYLNSITQADFKTFFSTCSLPWLFLKHAQQSVAKRQTGIELPGCIFKELIFRFICWLRKPFQDFFPMQCEPILGAERLHACCIPY